MSSTASLLIATADGGDKSARIRRLSDLIEREAGNSASGLPIINHGEARGTGVQTPSIAPGHVVLTLIDKSGRSHAFILAREWADDLCQKIRELRHPFSVKPETTGEEITCRRRPIPKPSGGIL